MTKVKKIWVMRQAGPIHLMGRSLVVPGYLENDSGRKVHLVVPFSQAKRLMLAAIKLLDTGPEGEGVASELTAVIATKKDMEMPIDPVERAAERARWQREDMAAARAGKMASWPDEADYTEAT